MKKKITVKSSMLFLINLHKFNSLVKHIKSMLIASVIKLLLKRHTGAYT